MLMPGDSEWRMYGNSLQYSWNSYAQSEIMSKGKVKKHPKKADLETQKLTQTPLLCCSAEVSPPPREKPE